MSRLLAFVVTSHGYGHASRQMEVIRVLLERVPDARALVLSSVPEAVFRDYLGPAGCLPRVTLVPYRADVGLVQDDGLAADPAATLRALAAAWTEPERAEAALARVLSEHRPAVVIGDVPPVAFGAAARLGVPSVAVGNFDWAWVYEFYAARDPAFLPWARLCARWQAQATAAVHLSPGPPLTAFPRVVEGGLLARRLLVDPRGIRERLGIPAGNRAVLASFGGCGLRDALRQIPEVPGVTWIVAEPMPDLGRPDTRHARDAPYLAVLAVCDAVFTKPGYGIIGDAARQRTRMAYVERGLVPELPWLVRWMEASMPVAPVRSVDFGSERGAEAVGAALEGLFAQGERWPEEAEAAARVAEVVEGLIG